MSRKARRLEARVQQVEVAKPEPTLGGRRRPLSRRGVQQTDFTDESQYLHVRGDLIRIGLLALTLFSALILLRVLTSALGVLP